jgi:hypothetical protein
MELLAPRGVGDDVATSHAALSHQEHPVTYLQLYTTGTPCNIFTLSCIELEHPVTYSQLYSTGTPCNIFTLSCIVLEHLVTFTHRYIQLKIGTRSLLMPPLWNTFTPSSTIENPKILQCSPDKKETTTTWNSLTVN